MAEYSNWESNFIGGWKCGLYVATTVYDTYVTVTTYPLFQLKSSWSGSWQGANFKCYSTINGSSTATENGNTCGVWISAVGYYGVGYTTEEQWLGGYNGSTIRKTQNISRGASTQYITASTTERIDGSSGMVRSTTVSVSVEIPALPSYYLDLNGYLDGTSTGNISGYGTADVYINNSRVATACTDFYQQYTSGSSYSITNVTANANKQYNGVHSGSASGTLDSDKSVYLSFSSIYNITYNGNGATGGSTSNQTRVHGSSAISLRSNGFTRTGYSFTNWNTNSAGSGTSYAAGASYSTNANLPLYAQWTPITYYVKYNATNGATGSMSNSTHTYNTSKALTSNAYSKTGHSFAGWSTSSSSTTISYKNGQSVLNLTSTSGGTYNLYTVWTPNTYTVTFNAEGGSTPTASKTVTYGGTYGTLPYPTKAGYNFLGWFTAASGGTQVLEGTTVSITAAQTLHAQWESAEIDAPTAYVSYSQGTATLICAENESEVPVATYHKWEKSIDGGKTFITVSGATTAESVDENAKSSYYYRVTSYAANGSSYVPNVSGTSIAVLPNHIGEPTTFSNENTYDWAFKTNQNLKSVNVRVPEGTVSSRMLYFDDELVDIIDIDYLCFTANIAGSTVSLTTVGTPTKGQAFEYSTNRTSWLSYTIGNVITISNAGDKIYFRGNNTTLGESSSIHFKFEMSGSIAGSGSVMTLLDKTDTLRDLTGKSYCFYKLFSRCTVLTSAPYVFATTLANSCYTNMFYGCTSLTKAPSLPATTLATWCYSDIFTGCTSLVDIPSLPATNLANSCYNYMFCNCSSLTTVPNLPATTLYTGCYKGMFYNCISLQINSSGTYAWRIPTTGTGTTATNALTNMLYGTTGTVTGEPSINTTYYCEYQPV